MEIVSDDYINSGIYSLGINKDDLIINDKSNINVYAGGPKAQSHFISKSSTMTDIGINHLSCNKNEFRIGPYLPEITFQIAINTCQTTTKQHVAADVTQTRPKKQQLAGLYGFLYVWKICATFISVFHCFPISSLMLF